MGSAFSINDNAATAQAFTAYTPPANAFLVAWRDGDTGKLAAQLLSGDGSPAGDPVAIDNPGSASGIPYIAANSFNGGFVLAWIDHAWSGPEHHDAMAQIIGVFCAADVNIDGMVDIDDVFAVLAAWGACGDPDDCPADVNGDDVVDIDDLFDVLAAWGPCP